MTLFPMNGNMYGGPLNLITIGATILLLRYSHLIRLKGYIRNAANILGDISYPLYLIHFPLGILLAHGLFINLDAVYFIGSLLLSCVFLILFDRYFKRMVFVPLAGMTAKAFAARKADPVAR